MTRYSRADWRARPARPGPGRLDPREVIGVALHWPAMSGRLDTVEEVMAALRSWQAYHMDSHGWSDIAYQEAIDQAGNVYRLRGLRTQPGANGDEHTNESYGALLLVVGPGEEPSEAMILAVRRRIARHRELFPRSKRIVGHGQIRPEPTACPGDQVQRLITRGVLNPDRKYPA